MQCKYSFTAEGQRRLSICGRINNTLLRSLHLPDKLIIPEIQLKVADRPRPTVNCNRQLGQITQMSERGCVDRMFMIESIQTDPIVLWSFVLGIHHFLFRYERPFNWLLWARRQNINFRAVLLVKHSKYYQNHGTWTTRLLSTPIIYEQPVQANREDIFNEPHYWDIHFEYWIEYVIFGLCMLCLYSSLRYSTWEFQFLRETVRYSYSSMPLISQKTEDISTWRNFFPRYLPFVRGNHR